MTFPDAVFAAAAAAAASRRARGLADGDARGFGARLGVVSRAVREPSPARDFEPGPEPTVAATVGFSACVVGGGSSRTKGWSRSAGHVSLSAGFLLRSPLRKDLNAGEMFSGHLIWSRTIFCMRL